MSILHICNAHFERELSGQLPPSLEKSFSLNSIFLQLQFLPLIYANEEDGILVTAFPKDPPPSLRLISDNLDFQTISSWGYSKLIKQWADRHNLRYSMPEWAVVQMVNSKRYSFAKSPLPGAHLLNKGDPIPPHFVLKSCFGAAGRGLIFSDHPRVSKFCEEEWKRNLPVIAEPWVNRICDFSTQWEISQNKEIQFLGLTFCKTSRSGIHQSNTVGDEKKERETAPFIEKQKRVAFPILKEMADFGYFGEVGFDAMIYLQDDTLHLQPVVEINARKTMGWVALMVQKKRAPKQKLELAYVDSQKTGPLPTSIGKINFSKQIVITIQEGKICE